MISIVQSYQVRGLGLESLLNALREKEITLCDIRRSGRSMTLSVPYS